MEEVERGERMPVPQSAVLGAKDLPRTILSDHIESSLFGKLKQERLERARFYGKTYDEVPGAEALVVRVVSSVDKKLEVKQQFLEIFQEENYPVDFGYKSKYVQHSETSLSFKTMDDGQVLLYALPSIKKLADHLPITDLPCVGLVYVHNVKQSSSDVVKVGNKFL
ncbi:histone acetyltransferase HAC1-like [Lactuca sativa]|uniref:histone acetyltransferase HAC1-like n=1 Tax=Lactuca sativa TaxID=4236 RepID=UPI0022AE6C6C|nr:histone acetyltransferase HAC1-like [Lactuca sativa]